MLSVENIRVAVAGNTVLRDISFTLPNGETTVLIGRNGAGKTTTLRAIMGLLPLAAGRILVNDRDLDGVATYERPALGLGYAPEDRRMIPSFSVRENLLLPTVALRFPETLKTERLRAVYDLMPELEELQNRSGGTLSGGQGKMVALGRALMVATDVLLLDEPFQGLAPVLAQSYARTLKKVRDQRPDLAVLVTESSPQLLGEVTDRALKIERGEISETTLAEAGH
ncbi:ABC transporter ATP-binding protein [Amorphus orientalis]|uniref:Branched-chain amino acid transport system ATP-binding protein n=1 Tax=Amorphus orientalis TaxID=649198 RepID=A0AAE3VKX3_9HYPH|nr:ATP-binding cassette domain-containing protein [Amorphus orientalis]MDQ0314379.1 branched-chain amino acid transport system ATP-binding protein [Amorphus orientalis]